MDKTLKYCTLLLFLLSMSLRLSAQEGYDDKMRASYVFYLAQKVKWNKDSLSDKFRVAILGNNPNLYDEFRKKADEKDSLFKRKIEVSTFRSISDLKRVDLVYLNKSSGVELYKLFEKLNGLTTLVISEGYEFNEAMIMLVEVKGQRRYSINPKILGKAGLRVSRLMLASAVKSREQWEEESKSAKGLLSQQNKKVREQRVEIYKQKEEIEKQQNKINVQKKELIGLFKNIEEQEKKLRDKLKELEIQEEKAKKLGNKLGNQQKRIELQKSEINEQLAKIETQKLMIYVFILFSILVLVMVFFIFRSYRIKKQANKQLKEKNDAIMIQNEEILQHKEEIEAQRDQIEEQLDELSIKNVEIQKQHAFVVAQRDQILEQKKEITDSIRYASRIQTAIHPPIDYLNNILPQHFVLYKPRDIVSGDYYWVREIKGRIIVIAADCTGHGVPGAFMSMLGISLLNEIVSKNPDFTASDILNSLRDQIISSLHQDGKEGEAKDGMDLALSIIDPVSKRIQFAGAYNPLYLIRNKNIEQNDEKTNPAYKIQEIDDFKVIQVKADRMPIGIHIKMKPFVSVDVEFASGDMIYMFSDGFTDQFGGDQGNKYMNKRFKKLLAGIQHEPLAAQHDILNDEFRKWRGEYQQVDDVLIVGVKL